MSKSLKATQTNYTHPKYLAPLSALNPQGLLTQALLFTGFRDLTNVTTRSSLSTSSIYIKVTRKSNRGKSVKVRVGDHAQGAACDAHISFTPYPSKSNALQFGKLVDLLHCNLAV